MDPPSGGGGREGNNLQQRKCRLIYRLLVLKIQMFNKLSKIFVVIMLGVVFVVPNLSSAADTGVMMTFDINPKILPRSNITTAIANVTIDLAKYGSYCSNINATSFNRTALADVLD
ncbi:MAG: hypothetical protein HYT64_02285 [Candidatus Yanofskybacteria bacterium]|nr:hypothetical protein [Candidatus Yanofskybacteria bacterium]